MKNEIIKKKTKLKGIEEENDNVSYNVCSKRVLLCGSVCIENQTNKQSIGKL